VLAIGIIAVALLLGAAVGRASVKSPGVGVFVFTLFGLAGGLAAARDPQAGLGVSLVAGAAAAVAGLLVLRFLLTRRHPDPQEVDRDRRQFIGRAGALAALALAAAAGGRALLERSRVVAARRDDVILPLARQPIPDPPPGSSLAVDDLTPLITPNADFYRIDTAPFSVPQVDLTSWKLRVTGLVDREIELSFEDLADLPMVERYVTLSCVSNEVGGDLIGTAKWLGTPLGDLLRRAGVRPEAQQIVGRSVDGFTVGFPVEAAFDGREALVAIGMNDEPLPFEHGFPARLVVAGLYGYVSATKWLSEIELTTWDGFDAYWIPRGWAKEAPIKTQSRIDTPRLRSRVNAGRVPIAGVAWAPTRGISRVEVRVDDDPWVEARLADTLDDDTWRQWSVVWDATPGTHQIQVRATDGTGAVQKETRSRPDPDGATGYHTISVDVA
jgi:DMSO/TMAO reductase YedYZ molybdopterin-dependent catalytic subunit